MVDVRQQAKAILDQLAFIHLNSALRSIANLITYLGDLVFMLFDTRQKAFFS